MATTMALRLDHAFLSSSVKFQSLRPSSIDDSQTPVQRDSNFKVSLESIQLFYELSHESHICHVSLCMFNLKLNVNERGSFRAKVVGGRD